MWCIPRKTGNGKKSQRDCVVELLWDRLQDEMAWRALCHFVNDHEVDTDCIEDDAELFAEEKSSILHGALHGDDEATEAVQSLLRHLQSVSTAIIIAFAFSNELKPQCPHCRATAASTNCVGVVSLNSSKAEQTSAMTFSR